MREDLWIQYWAHMLDEAMDKSIVESNEKELRAKFHKNDEFYTSFEDVEKTLKPFANKFRGKSVLCNCDNPEWSQTYLWLALSFEDLGLKELMGIGYGCTYMHVVDAQHPAESPLKVEADNGGDFRTGISLRALKRCDVVVSNPPFSKNKESEFNMFVDFIRLPIENGKDVIGIGPTHGITYDYIADKIKDKKLNVLKSPYRWFKSPEGYDKDVQVSVYTTFMDVKSISNGSQIPFNTTIKLDQLPIRLDGVFLAMNSKGQVSKLSIPTPSALTNRKCIIVPYNVLELEWRKHFRFVGLESIKDNFYIQGEKVPVSKFKGCLMQYKSV